MSDAIDYNLTRRKSNLLKLHTIEMWRDICIGTLNNMYFKMIYYDRNILNNKASSWVEKKTYETVPTSCHYKYLLWKQNES